MKGFQFGSDCIRCANMFLLLAVAALAACAPAGGAEYHVSSNRPSAQVVVTNENGSAFVDIHSDNGIGDATVTLVDGAWPDAITLRFHLEGLEQMQFVYGNTVAGLSVTTQNMLLQGAAVDGSPIEAIDETSRYWMAVSFLDRNGNAVDSPAAGGVIEVQAPADFFEGAHAEFTINWIDFYR